MTLDDILLQARKVGASDVHVSVGIPIKCRIHGTLQDLTSAPLNGEDTKTLIQQMIPKRLIASFNETGEADFSYAIPGHGRFRVNVFKQKGSMAFVIRLINTEIPEPESLGLTPSVIDLINKKRGLILVTGPTGSGKSTTLYTALSELNTTDVNIITVEDPVEANIDGINQVQVNPKADLTFASALRSILRQDPDIIMIGEIRDQETAAIAVQASITGHLVVSTLHTNSAASSITRLEDMGIESYLIADSVIGVIAQRLVRRLCPECKKPRAATPDEKKFMGQDVDKNITIYEPCGCPKCDNTGYKGRIGVYEIMRMTPALKQIISKRQGADILKEKAMQEGMRTLRMSGSEYVMDGTTSFAELVKISFDV